MKQANQANERQFRGLFWFYRTANSGMARNSLQGKLLNPLLEGVSMIERQPNYKAYCSNHFQTMQLTIVISYWSSRRPCTIHRPRHMPKKRPLGSSESAKLGCWQFGNLPHARRGHCLAVTLQLHRYHFTVLVNVIVYKQVHVTLTD